MAVVVVVRSFLGSRAVSPMVTSRRSPGIEAMYCYFDEAVEKMPEKVGPNTDHHIANEEPQQAEKAALNSFV